MKRRSFITLLGGVAAAWPLAAQAQQQAMPLMGFLHSQSPEGFGESMRGLRRDLKEAGFVEGERTSRSTTDGPRTNSTGCPLSPPNWSAATSR